MGKTIHSRLFSFMLLAVPCTLIAFSVFQAEREVYDWLSLRGAAVTTGVVVCSGVIQQHSRHRVIFIPKIRFSYCVDGVQYTNDTSNCRKECYFDCDAAKSVVERYPEGVTFPVYYREFDPRYSVFGAKPLFPCASLLVDFAFALIGCFSLWLIQKVKTRN